jgi:hypothetical protein
MPRQSPGQRIAALGELGSSLPLATIGLLIANDHLLKFVFHNAVTGKLSDFAICFLMPLLISAVLGLITRLEARRRLWIGAVVTVAIFSALEMSDAAGAGFVRAVGLVFGAKHTVLTRDPTDLFALLFVPLAVAYGRRRALAASLGARARRLGGALALITGSLALMATSAPERCGKWSGPMVFKVEGDCGTGGLIVVEGDGWSGRLTITNHAALLAPPANGQLTVNEVYNGTACPYTFDQGKWAITYGYCSTPAFAAPLPLGDAGADSDAGATPDAGVTSDAGGASDAGAAHDAGTPSSSSCPSGYRQCDATLESDGLWFTCRADPATVLCRSKLTVQP